MPAIESHSEDEETWSSEIDNSGASGSQSEDEYSDDEPSSKPHKPSREDPNEEMPYEVAPRQGGREWEESDEEQGIERLPVKLADGRVVRTGEKILQRTLADSSGEESDEGGESGEQAVRPSRAEDVATGARFGRSAVVAVISTSSRKVRIQSAKEQIAGICQEIIADPENSVCATCDRKTESAR